MCTFSNSDKSRSSLVLFEFESPVENDLKHKKIFLSPCNILILSSRRLRLELPISYLVETSSQEIPFLNSKMGVEIRSQQIVPPKISFLTYRRKRHFLRTHFDALDSSGMSPPNVTKTFKFLQLSYDVRVIITFFLKNSFQPTTKSSKSSRFLDRGRSWV